MHTSIHPYIHTYMHIALFWHCGWGKMFVLLKYVHTYIHTYMHAYIHTYIHTYIHSIRYSWRPWIITLSRTLPVDSSWKSSTTSSLLRSNWPAVHGNHVCFWRLAMVGGTGGTVGFGAYLPKGEVNCGLWGAYWSGTSTLDYRYWEDRGTYRNT